MRFIGYIGILALLGLAALGLVSATQARDWKGIGLMLGFIALLCFFAITLWRGRQLERAPSTGDRLAAGWAGESVTSFIRNQVLNSAEGLILVVGSALSFAVAIAALLGFVPSRGGTTATLFGLWPVVAFVAYVKFCGPRFATSTMSVLITLAVALVPFWIAFKWAQ